MSTQTVDLPDQEPTAEFVERRSTERYPCQKHCFVRPEGAGGPADWPGLAYNVSTGGIGVALPLPVQPGTVLLLQPLGREGKPFRVRVVRSVLVSFVYFHGCVFQMPLTGEELEAWIR